MVEVTWPLRYVLENGCKENPMARPGQWPGPNSVRALLHGGTLRGVWHDQTSDWEARRRGKTIRFHDFRSSELVVLEPLPCWQHLPPEEIQERVLHMVREIEHDTAERHRRNGSRILGPKAVQEVHPHDSVQSPKRSPRPAFHAATREVREAMKQAYRELAEFFRAAAQDLRADIKGIKFPPGSFPPGLPYVPPEAAPA
jgi:hypothetical protein